MKVSVVRAGLSVLSALSVMSAQKLPAQQTVASSLSTSVVDVRDAEQNLRKPVTIDLAGVPLKRALAEISARSGVSIQYRGDVVEPYTRSVTLHAIDVPLATVLTRVLANTRLVATPLSEGRVGVIERSADMGFVLEDGVITGRVRHAKTQEPIVGATILIDNDSKGAITGVDGSYRIAAAPGERRVSVRAIGFVRRASTVTVREGDAVAVDFLLEPSASVLNEVIVTGTVVATARKAIPNPITVITAEDIDKRGVTRVEQLFHGEVPGIVAMDQASGVYRASLGSMESAQVFSRGASKLGLSYQTDPNPPKTYIDGIELLDPSYLGTIDPKSIERIEIITGPQAATVYGSGAMGGVVQIFTKKGGAYKRPDLTLNAKYGMLQSNVANGLAPMHNDALLVNGGTGSGISYSGTLTHNYSGQWQPDLFSRRFGTSLGATYLTGPVTLSASVAATAGRNGTSRLSITERSRYLEGEWKKPDLVGSLTLGRRNGTSSSQTFGLNADYRATPGWQHHLTIGRSQNKFTMSSEAPVFSRPADSLFTVVESNGQRTTFGYNTTVFAPRAGALTSSLTMGMNGSSGDQAVINGCRTNSRTASLAGCTITVSLPIQASSWGGFAKWQLGIMEQLYFTLGLRGERNTAYGRKHSIDWTPTNGASYTIERGNLTLKLLGSYGLATRPPTNEMRLAVMSSNSNYSPDVWQLQLESPNLTPEYARGPQGGFELYYGNRGSITVNRYVQTVTDLIQRVKVDSVRRLDVSKSDSIYVSQFQYLNVASIRQQGWEVTSTLSLAALTLKGTYSWTDSRVRSVHPTTTVTYPIGSTSGGVPTHIGNLTASYAYGRTSITLATNVIGQVMQGGTQGPLSELFYYERAYGRLPMYVNRANSRTPTYPQPGYAKSDLSFSQRLAPWVSFDVNVTNLENSYGTDAALWYPSLGRQTLIGFSLRNRR